MSVTCWTVPTLAQYLLMPTVLVTFDQISNGYALVNSRYWASLWHRYFTYAWTCCRLCRVGQIPSL